jgi:uncharacterized membrane protein YeiB
MELSERRPGPDVVRALAMAGVVVMNYHGYLILRGASRDRSGFAGFFDPWTGPLSTRFAATFVLTAGVGVTLMTRSSTGNAEATRSMRWRLVRRGLLLYGFGLLFDQIWSGTILPYYGAMFVVAAAMFTWRSRWILLLGAAAAVVAWTTRWWLYERSLDGHDTSWLTNPGGRSPRGALFNVMLNGTHPLLPWLAFLCTGIVIGRMLTLSWWRPAAAGVGFVLYAAASIVDASVTSDRARALFNDDPFDRSGVYVASALGTALLAFVTISWAADRFASAPVVDALRRAGQLSLTVYIAHALVFNLLVDTWDIVQPAGVGTALTFAATFWMVAITGAVAYQRHFGRGPAETVYRLLTN